jgi:hypothetical protein
MGHLLLALDSPLMEPLQTQAALTLAASVEMTRKTRPDDPLVSLLGNSLLSAFQAVAAEGINTMGATDDLMDHALAATLGWLLVAGPEHLQPMGGDAALRIERFIRRALQAAELTRETLLVGMETRGAA